MLETKTTTFDPHSQARDARLAAMLAAFDHDHASARAWARVAECHDLRAWARRLGGDARAWTTIAIRLARCP